MQTVSTRPLLEGGGRGLGQGYTCTDMSFGTTAIVSLCLSCSQEVKAVELHFPNAQHHGCYYHFMQAIWRKVQLLGLQEKYRAESSALKKLVQKMAATAFCPPAFMRLAWQGAQQEAPTMDRIDDLVTYFD